MLTVIGAGLPRTGTLSLKAALERLGFGPCYHMFEIFAHPEYVARWPTSVQASGHDWDAVFDGYRSAVDQPTSFFWRELAELNPEAKVVLTVRDPRRWFASFHMLREEVGKLLTAAEREAAAGTEPSPFFAAQAKLSKLMTGISEVTFGVPPDDRVTVLEEAVAIRRFEEHSAAVRAGLPPERLLEFDVAEGWRPLCDFVGVPIPAGEPFPHLNDGAAFRQDFDTLTTKGKLDPP